jgi:hypothetical protein
VKNGTLLREKWHHLSEKWHSFAGEKTLFYLIQDSAWGEVGPSVLHCYYVKNGTSTLRSSFLRERAASFT